MIRITTVNLDGPVIPWAAVGSLAIGNVVVLLMAMAGVFNILTLDNPISYLVLVGIDVFAIACWPMTWVRVDYLGEDDQPGRAYFTPASVLTRWKGGAKRLYDLLRRQAGLAE
jgi:hypothetical protein